MKTGLNVKEKKRRDQITILPDQMREERESCFKGGVEGEEGGATSWLSSRVCDSFSLCVEPQTTTKDTPTFPRD